MKLNALTFEYLNMNTKYIFKKYLRTLLNKYF